MPDFEGRRGRLLKLMAKESASSMLITDGSNVTYLTGFSGDSSYLWVHAGKVLLISDARFEEQIGEECPGWTFSFASRRSRYRKLRSKS